MRRNMMMRMAALAAASTMLMSIGCDSNPSAPEQGVLGVETVVPTDENYMLARTGGDWILNEGGRVGEGLVGHGVKLESSTVAGRNISSELHQFERTDFAGEIPRFDSTYRSLQIIFVGDDASDDLVRAGAMALGSVAHGRPGVEVRWTDPSNRVWSSAFGTPSGTFMVEEHVPVASLRPGGRYRSSGTFAVRLYDVTGNSIDLTDGRFSMPTVYGAGR